MKFWAMTSLLISTQCAFAVEGDAGERQPPKVAEAVMRPADAGAEGECPNRRKLMNMCMFIGSRVRDKQPIGPSEYLYYRRILEASCVDADDSEQIAQKKIQAMWLEFEPEMVCASTIFDVVHGSYLKYAVATKFNEFLENAIEWQVNLNKVDPSDGRTVLDYVAFHQGKNKGNVVEKKLNYYYEILREAGAKHKSEL